MVKDLEIAVQCAPCLPEADQAELAEVILAALEQQGVIQRERLETILF